MSAHAIQGPPHRQGSPHTAHLSNYLSPEGRNLRVGTPSGASGKTGPLKGL